MVDKGEGARFALLGAAHSVAGERLVRDRVLVRHEAEHLGIEGQVGTSHYKAQHDTVGSTFFRVQKLARANCLRSWKSMDLLLLRSSMTPGNSCRVETVQQE